MPDIKIIFQDQEYTIPESRAFEVGERVEEIVSLVEIPEWMARPKFRKMSRCFAEMLRCAGARVTDQDVHKQMMVDYKNGDPGFYYTALNVLVAVLMDGAPEGGGGDAPGKTNAS